MWGSGESGSALGSGLMSFNNTSVEPQENLSLSCAARNIQGSVMLPYSETGVIIARGINVMFTFLIMLIGGFLNIFVIVLVVKYKRLRTVSFGIALQIVAFNILLSIFVSPFSLITTITNVWLFTESVCSFVGICIYLAFIAKTFLMFIFTIDRLFSVFCTFTYPKYQAKTVMALSILSFVYALIASGIGYLLDCYGFAPFYWQCVSTGDCSQNCSTYLRLNGGFITFVRILSLVFFGLLFMKARKAQNAMATTTESVSTQQPKHNWKATITFFMLFLSLFVLSIPSIATLIFTSILFGEKREASTTANVLNTVALHIISLLLITDPIIMLRNGDVREILKGIKEEAVRRYYNTNKN